MVSCTVPYSFTECSRDCSSASAVARRRCASGATSTESGNYFSRTMVNEPSRAAGRTTYPFDYCDSRTFIHELHPLVFEELRMTRQYILVLQPLIAVNNCHRGSKAAHRLCQFQTDIPAPENDEMLWHIIEFERFCALTCCGSTAGIFATNPGRPHTGFWVDGVGPKNAAVIRG